MNYTLEYLSGPGLKSEDGAVKSESELEALVLKLDAEKYVSICFVHSNQNIMTVSGGREQYVVMFSDASRFYELNNLNNKGGEKVLLRTGLTVGKFHPEMVIDPFTTIAALKEFYRTGIRSIDLNWKPLN